MTTPRKHRPSARGPLPLANAAITAARRGWKIFPAKPKTKIPAVKDWETVATDDLDAIHDWWANRPYNVGIACGPSRLVVIDLDPIRDELPHAWAHHQLTHGRDTLALIAERDGFPLEPTYSVRTPATSGEHRYHLAPDSLELRNTAGASGRGLGPGIDVRAAGGYVIAAGSVLRTEQGRRRYILINDIAPTPLPDPLVKALTPPPPSERSAGRLHIGSTVDAYLRTPLRQEADRVRNARHGERAATTFKAAANLGELVGNGILDEATATTVLLDAARVHNGIAGWDDDEALHHIVNGITRGRGNPRRINLAR